MTRQLKPPSPCQTVHSFRYHDILEAYRAPLRARPPSSVQSPPRIRSPSRRRHRVRGRRRDHRASRSRSTDVMQGWDAGGAWHTPLTFLPRLKPPRHSSMLAALPPRLPPSSLPPPSLPRLTRCRRSSPLRLNPAPRRHSPSPRVTHLLRLPAPFHRPVPRNQTTRAEDTSRTIPTTFRGPRSRSASVRQLSYHGHWTSDDAAVAVALNPAPARAFP